MVTSVDDVELAPHVVQDDGSGGRAAPSQSSGSSQQGMYGDASDETRQINAIEPVEDDAIMGTLNVSSHPSQENSTSQDTREIFFDEQGGMGDASMGTSSEVPMSTSSTAPSSISFSFGDNDGLWLELGRANKRRFRDQTVVWRHGEEDIFSSAFVCPFSGECFLSGTLETTEYAGRDLDLQWYLYKVMAKDAALKRFLDCYTFRAQQPNSPADTSRHCLEEPYRKASSIVLPPSIPQRARQVIQLYQQEILASAAPSMASSDISPLTISNGSPALRPREHDILAPRTRVLIAPSEDRNARSVLNERYQNGMINGNHVQGCPIDDAYFLVHTIGSSHQPYFTCIFVCPLFGDCFSAGESRRDQPSSHLAHGLKWFRRKTQAKIAAAARAVDCFEYREGRSNGATYCVEEPYMQGNGPPLPMLCERVFSAQIQQLQADASERLQRFGGQN